MKTVLIAVTFLILSNSSFATTYYSRVAAGNFATLNSWSISTTGIPANIIALEAVDVFIIQNGHNITVAAAATCAGITINTGGTLTSGTAITFTVNGPWLNNGTFTQSTGTVTFGGASAAINSGTGTENFRNIQIASGTTMTINAPVTAAGTFIYAATAANSGVTISATNSLTVTGAFTMPNPSATRSSTFAVGGGTLTVNGLFSMAGTSGTQFNALTISGGTVNLNAGITTTTAGSVITFSAAGILNIVGAVTGGPPNLTPSTGTVNFNGATAQTIWLETYYRLGVAGANTKTLGGNTTVTNILTINTGSTLALSSFILTLSGTGSPLVRTGTLTPATGTVIYSGTTANVAGGSYYNLQASTAGAKTLGATTTVTNVLTINTGSTLALSTFTLTLSGTGIPLVATGTLTPNTGTVIYSGATATVASTSYYNLQASTAGAKTLGAATSVANILTINAGSNLTLSTFTLTLSGTGTPLVDNGTFTASAGSTVIYSGATATIAGETYANLQTSTAGIKALGNNTTVSEVLTINSGTLDLSNRTLTLSGSGTPLVNSGTFTPTTSTVIYSSATATNMALLDYFNLTGSVGTKNFPAGTIGIAGTFNPAGGTYVVDNANIVNFNGAGPIQTIPAFVFKKVILSGSGQKIVAVTVAVKEVDIQDGPTLDITTGQLDIL
jgi:hypothetical protein